tara:strand:- start:2275 stop:2769 length:495 start_codon:yes stop_codon:yes gene_type:complete
MDHDISRKKLVEMALDGLSWAKELAFEDHAETVFDEFEDDPGLSHKENQTRFWGAVNEAQLIAEQIVDIGTSMVWPATRLNVHHVLIIDQGIPDDLMTFINEEDAKEYMLDMVRQTILGYEKNCTDWENVESDHNEELLAKDTWENGYFCCYDVEFRCYTGVIQ